jgi:YegS/Rv2252/BmrU family lipid kinase
MIIVFNPTAGRRRTHLLWRVLDVLAENGIRVDLVRTRRPGHATELAREATRAGAPLVVAAGGDGTVAEVAAGLLGSRTRLGIIPLGTANVLAHELALPMHPRAVAAALAFGRAHPIWPGIATIGSAKRLFVQMLGVGLDAEVVQRLPPAVKRLLGRGAYAMQTLGEATRYHFAPLSVVIDGRTVEARSVVVSKGRLYGGPYVLAPGADSGAPGFSVVLFGARGVVAALACAAALPLNLLPHAPGLSWLQGRVVEIRADRAVPAQSDGDIAGTTPVLVHDADSAIEVVIGR